LRFPDLPEDVTRHEADGNILFVTVSSPHLNAFQRLLASFDDDIFVETFTERFGSSTPQSEREIALQMMRDAKDVAEYVAYRRLGLGGELTAGEVVVGQILCRNGRAANEADCDELVSAGEFLSRGATITAVNGIETPTTDDLTPVMKAVRPGDVVEVRFRPPREEAEREVEITTFASPEDPNRALIGFVPHDTFSVDLPFEAEIDTNRIGGPSAGLAFTLTLIDSLSPGSLTGGKSVAVTGTIREDGTVGAIGGLHQKVVAVQQAGGDYFIVPLAQGEEALADARRAAGPGLEIVPVATLEEALSALAARGGTPIPPAPVA
jgi:PDZ domain-containing protein